MKRQTFIVSTALSGRKIDQALVQLTDGLSRRKIRRALDRGHVSINNKVVRLASRTVAAGDRVALLLENTDRSDAGQPQLSHSHVVAQPQPDLVILNKPPLIECSTTEDHSSVGYQLKNQLPALFPSGPFLCHRLDKETSGLLAVAASSETCDKVSTLFRQRRMEKTYLAVCWGQPQKTGWEVRCYLSPIRQPAGKVEVVHAGGKTSTTLFRVLAVNPDRNLSLVRCVPKTGRSHQIRVHLGVSSGLPIVGDKKYDSGTTRSSRCPQATQIGSSHHLLHAYRLGMRLPDWSEREEFQAPTPPAFAACLRLPGWNTNEYRDD